MLKLEDWRLRNRNMYDSISSNHREQNKIWKEFEIKKVVTGCPEFNSF